MREERRNMGGMLQKHEPPKRNSVSPNSRRCGERAGPTPAYAGARRRAAPRDGREPTGADELPRDVRADGGVFWHALHLGPEKADPAHPPRTAYGRLRANRDLALDGSAEGHGRSRAELDVRRAL